MDTISRRSSGIWLGAVASALGAAAVLLSTVELERMPKAAEGADLLYLPSGKYLSIASLGQREVLADAIYLWSIQYYGHYEAGNRYVYLDKIFREVITELDPKYTDPYWIGALIMTVEAKNLDMGLALLDKGIAANPDQWILPYLAGWECYHAKKYDRAQAYFERAIGVPNAPPSLRRAYAGMFQKLGDKRAALASWKELVRDPAVDDRTRDIAARRVRDLEIEVDIETLSAAVARYRSERGSNPPSLAALEGAHLVDPVPVDPDGRPYLYDRSTGAVRPANAYVLGGR
jgi:tetratricopeptide (TPR) repeat protein